MLTLSLLLLSIDRPDAYGGGEVPHCLCLEILRYRISFFFRTRNRFAERTNDNVVNATLIRLSLGKLLVNLLQVAKPTNTPLIP